MLFRLAGWLIASFAVMIVLQQPGPANALDGFGFTVECGSSHDASDAEEPDVRAGEDVVLAFSGLRRSDRIAGPVSRVRELGREPELPPPR